MQVARSELRWSEKIYLPVIMGGMVITFKHLCRTIGLRLFPKNLKPGQRSVLDMSSTGMVTMQYPDEKWPMPDGYRGAPTLVKDEEGREKCVSCQLCEFVCPPRAIKITPGALPSDSHYSKVEKGPKEFDIDMVRCIYCGLCEEVCPEEAIYLRKDYALVGRSRADLMHNKAKLYEMGGVMVRPVKKWANK